MRFMLPLFSSVKYKNLIFNYSGSITNGIVPIIAIPFYLRMFGIELWGVVSFTILLQSLVATLEAGLSQALLKEFYSRRKSGDLLNASQLLREFEYLYLLAAVLVVFFIWFISEYLVISWININEEQYDVAKNAIIISGFIIAGQLPNSLYRAVIQSNESHLSQNLISSCAITLRHLVGVCISGFYGSIILLLVWFFVSSILELVVRRYCAWFGLPLSLTNSAFRLIEMRKVSSFAIKMIAGTTVGAITVQVDKVVVSKVLNIEEFSYFAIATSLSMGFLQLFYPIMITYLPLLISAQDNRRRLLSVNKNLTKTLLAILVLVWTILMLFGYDLMKIWLQDEVIVRNVFPIFIVLFVGTTLNTLYGIGLNNLLAAGRADQILYLNIIAMGSVIIVLPFSVYKYGLIGASTGWVMFNLIAFIYILISFNAKK